MADNVRYKCGKCGTEYFRPGECDWCPGERLQLEFQGDCKTALGRAYEHIRNLEVKAKRWDAALLACHRMGGQCAEVIKKVIESVRRV